MANAAATKSCHARHFRNRWQAVSGVMFVNVVCRGLAERPIRSGQLQYSPALHRPGGLIWTNLYPIILISFGFVFVQAFRGRVSWRVAAPFAINLVANLLFIPIPPGYGTCSWRPQTS